MVPCDPVYTGRSIVHYGFKGKILWVDILTNLIRIELNDKTRFMVSGDDLDFDVATTTPTVRPPAFAACAPSALTPLNLAYFPYLPPPLPNFSPVPEYENQGDKRGLRCIACKEWFADADTDSPGYDADTGKMTCWSCRREA